MEWLNAKFKLIETIQPKIPLPLDVVKCNYCKKKIQLCYNAVLNVELHCSSMVKGILIFYA